MKSRIKILAVLAGLTLVAAGSNTAFANCTQGGAVFSVFQCGFGAWFAPPPAGSGGVTASWWQLGYGNSRANAGNMTAGTEGTGITPAGVFSGNDSGNFQPVLTLADDVLGNYAADIPDGSLCSNYENSWGAYGVDGCADNPRGTSAYDNNDRLNNYFSPPYGTSGCPDAPYYSLNYQIDYPMAMLLREGTGRFFSLAFIASKSRGADPLTRCVDNSAGVFDLGEVSNGDPNPAFAGKFNQIPWQPVPRPNVDSAIFTGATSPRQLALSWPGVRIVSDQSNRPSARTNMVDNTPSDPTIGPGVGVLNQGSLCRYVLESAPLAGQADPANPDPTTMTWTPLQTIPCPAGGNVTANVTVDPDTALRVRTILGKNPRTTSTLLGQARIGASGDLGFEATQCDGAACPVSPPLTIIGGTLVSEKVADLSATKSKNAVSVRFRTTSELSIENIAVLAISGKGELVVTTVTPLQGNTGVGAEYSVELSMSDLKGAKEIAVRLEGSGGNLIDRSAPVRIQ